MARIISPNSVQPSSPVVSPWMTAWFGAWAGLMLLLTAAFIQNTWLQPLTAHSASVEGELTSEVLVLANQQRRQAGLDALASDGRLTEAAEKRARDMISRGYFAHYFEQSTPWQFIDATGYTGWHYAGENLAKNFSSAEGMVDAWLNSPAHRDNLLSASYNRTGVATVTGRTPAGDQVTVTVQLFTGS